MAPINILILCFLIRDAVAASHASELTCLTRTSGKQVSLDIRRNQTGHWLTQVELKTRGGPMSGVDSSAGWSVELSQSTSSCKEGENILETIINLTAPPPRAGPDYELFPAMGYYKFHARSEPWLRARQVCVEEGAHLAIPNSEREVDIFKVLFASNPKINNTPWNDWAWVGLHEQGTDKEYFTIFGEPMNTTGFSRWYPGERGDANIDDALLVHRATGGLADGTISTLAAFICEQEL